MIARAYVKGVFTRKLEALVVAMGLEGMSKSEVSRICARLDEQVEVFRMRPLLGRYPYLWLDATYEKVPDDSGRVVSMALVAAYGVAETGEREVVGLEVCRSEDLRLLAGVSLRPDLPRSFRGGPGGLRCSQRTEAGDSGGLSGSQLAKMPGVLP